MFDLVPFYKNSLGRKGDFLDNIMENFFPSDFLTQGFSNTSSFRLDVKEDENNYMIQADLPGISKEAINIEYENNYLTISAKRDSSNEESGDNYIRRERSYGQFSRALYVDNIDESNITASFKDGVLSVVLPKLEKEALAKKKIAIN